MAGNEDVAMMTECAVADGLLRPHEAECVPDQRFPGCSMRAIAGFAKATATSVATTVAILVATLTFAGPALAKIPPPTEAAKAAADEAKAKSAWSDKVAAYQLCLVQDRVAARYRQSAAAQGKQASQQALPTPPCADPGPYVPQT